MKVQWLNKGEPDAEGVYTAALVTRSGKEITRWSGPSKENVREQMDDCTVRERGR